MKKALSLILSLIIFTSATSLQDMITAFQKGDASAISQFLDNRVEITISGETESYDRNKASAIITSFFNGIAVSGFQIIHKSESSGSQYFIGNLKSNKGTYRTTIYVKTKNGKQVIQELRFEG